MTSPCFADIDSQINAGVQAADAVSDDTKGMFTNADEWLTKKLDQASPPLANGTS